MTEFDHDAANLWLIRVSTGAPARAAQWDCLIESERQRARAFHFDRDRWLYVKAHAWLRTVLGQVTARSPQAVHIAEAPGKKPFTACPGPDRSRVHFNLSHTQGLIAIAVSTVCEVGIDVERIRPLTDLEGLTATVLHPAEQARFDALSEKERAAYFFRVWTVKEAYTKATGQGLARAFAGISVDFCDRSRDGSTTRLLDADGVDIQAAHVVSMPAPLVFMEGDCEYAFAFAALMEQGSVVIHHHTD